MSDAPPRSRWQLSSVPGGAAFARLSRRVRTLVVGGVLFLVLFVVALTLPVPYVVLKPGCTWNTIGTDTGCGGPGDDTQIITLVGREPRSTSGHLEMTTISVSDGPVTAFEALWGWLMSDKVVVPRSAIYPPGESTQRVDKENAADFQASQDSATTAALCELGYPSRLEVQQIVPKGPSDGTLKLEDQLLSVAGRTVTDRASLLAALAGERPGTSVPVQVVRDKKPVRLTVTVGTSPDKTNKGGYLGVVTGGICAAPFTVQIKLANVGGPSAGLMFALGVIDKAGDQDLTGGKFVAGTGTIDADGNVGEIGGIALKMIAARDKGATVFLAPKGNCPDVRGAVPSGLRVVAVSTLHEAVTDLEGLRAGTANPPGC